LDATLGQNLWLFKLKKWEMAKYSFIPEDLPGLREEEEESPERVLA